MGRAKRAPYTTAASTETCTVAVLPIRDNVHFPGIVSTLLVGREISLHALELAMRSDKLVLVLGQRERAVDEPTVRDMYRVGTLSEIMQVLPMPDGTMRAVLRGLSRCKVEKLTHRKSHFGATALPIHTTSPSGPTIDALKREIVQTFEEISALEKSTAADLIDSISSIPDPGLLADTVANHLFLKAAEKQEILETFEIEPRLRAVVRMLTSTRQVLSLQSDLREQVERELGNTQREYYLREQLRALQSELSGPDELSPDGQELFARLEAAGMPGDVMERATTELRRFERAPASSPESMVIRTYLECLAALPWRSPDAERVNIREAAQILDRNHYGVPKVKDRILDFLAVRQLNPDLRGPILCFAGPPGVGKTTLGRSIAEALGRKFVRVSLGGVRDEAEIRGHRRTYVGSMPGRIIHQLRQCGSRAPVFVLDEVDKMGMDYRGDPTSALLEVLDPEQNSAFVDHYIEVPFDLSNVMFILTANVVSSIPAALRDRMEVVWFPSYTEDEKLRIAHEHLLPRKLAEHGLQPDQLTLSDDTLLEIMRHYTHEAGVRGLEREIAGICRKVARQVANGDQPGTVDLVAALGKPRFRYGTLNDRDEIGTSTGLVVTEFGGDIVTIEANLLPNVTDEPQVHFTGCLGQVMRESAITAVTFMRAWRAEHAPETVQREDVHIHVPEGAVPKDGPSAGLAIALALISAVTRRPVRRDVAITGELTLRGKVLPVGGIREKALAAHRAGIRTLILPEENLADLDEVPASVREQMTIVPVSSVGEALDIALGSK